MTDFIRCRRPWNVTSLSSRSSTALATARRLSSVSRPPRVSGFVPFVAAAMTARSTIGWRN
jgi:hypothetical protein